MTELTILMPTFNRARVLRETLEAMCRVRRAGLSIELVVIDNGSTDDTAAVLRELSARLPLTSLWEPTAGKCHALNRALREVRLRELVVFTDDDVTPEPAWLETVVAVSQRWPQHSVFGGRIDPVWPSGVAVPFWAADKLIQHFAFSAHHVSEREGPYPTTLEPFGPNYWVRRSALEGVEFRADLGPHPTRCSLGDETEFLRQLRGKGFAPIYAPSARVLHRIEAERTTEAAIYRRAFQYGKGNVHVSGMPEQQLLRRSRLAWHLRVASNVGMGAWQLLNAALDPDERVRFSRVVARTITFAQNVEALRWSALAAMGRAPAASSPGARSA